MRYVGRYATSRAKLVGYLSRKVRERGWDGSGEPDLGGIASRFAELGYVDDAAYALAKSQALSSRGYGKRRINERLRLAGIGEEEGAAARHHADAHAIDSALRFAERRRIGPFAQSEIDLKQREKAIASMLRAGHSFALAKAIVSWPRDSEIDRQALAERARLVDA